MLTDTSAGVRAARPGVGQGQTYPARPKISVVGPILRSLLRRTEEEDKDDDELEKDEER